MINIPNILTMIRLILIPIFALTFFSNINNSFTYSIFIFLTAGITDVLDGYIARKYNLVTKWGTVFDPLADKLMLITVLISLTKADYIPIWVVLIIVVKEIVMILGGAILYNKDSVIPANIFGKASTLFFYLSIFLMIFDIQIGNYFLYFAVISAIIALVNYALLYKKTKL